MNEDGELNILDLVIMVNLVLYGDDGACIDIDGNVYETVQIGEQVWMAENLKVTHYNDGSEIPTGHSDSEWAELETDAYAMYEDDPSNADIYGNLYNWYAVDDDRGVCPDGWHVPSDGEWTVLTDYLGGQSLAGGKMKEAGFDHWNSPNTGATNESGFTALPAGLRFPISGSYDEMGDHGRFWSSSDWEVYYPGGNAWLRTLRYDYTSIGQGLLPLQFGFSIRCLKD
jgi:uncharacterized protein (TIGR02145 family)